MTHEQLKEKVEREHTKSYLKAVELLPFVIQRFEEELVSFNKNRSVDKPIVYFGSKDFQTNDYQTVVELTKMLEEYITNQGWLLSIKYPESYYMDVTTAFRMYTDTRKHRFYVWLQDTFNSSFSWDSY